MTLATVAPRCEPGPLTPADAVDSDGDMTVRDDYRAAVEWYVGVVDAAAAADPALGGAGLGEWSRRELVAHTARSLSTVVDYTTPADGSAIDVEDAAGYYAIVLRADPAEVAARARAAAEAAGDDVVGHVHRLAEAAVATVASAPVDADAATPFARMTLDAYLPTRTLELVVHGLDLTPVAEVPSALLAPVLATLSAIAVTTGRGVDAVRTLAGRDGARVGLFDPL